MKRLPIFFVCILLLAAPAGATLYYFDMDSDQGHSGTFYTQSGYTSVTAGTIYLPSVNLYGWDLQPEHRDRGAYSGTTDLTRDFHCDTDDRTFTTALGSGDYEVTLTFRDNIRHNNIQVYAEGDLAAWVDDMANYTTYTRTFTVSVTDGALDLLFHDNGGSDDYWVINGIDIDYDNVPLPASVLLLGPGLLWLAGLRRFRKK